MQPAIILDLQKEFLTEATSAPKLFRDLGKVEQYVYNVALTGSAVIWVYLIQISKIVVGKKGTSFESELLKRPFADLSGMELLHPRIVYIVTSFCSTFPHGINTFKKDVEAIWNDMIIKIGISFFKDVAGWSCYWMPFGAIPILTNEGLKLYPQQTNTGE
jgi:hypothetical protein